MFPLLLIGLIIGVVILAGCQKRTTSGAHVQSAVTISNMNSAELQRRLEVLAKSPSPENLKMGAMCYDMANGSTVLDYVCPECMQKTVYVRDEKTKDFFLLLCENLPRCRALVKNLTLIRARLDESAFCSHCASKGSKPALTLFVQLDSKGPEHRTSPVNAFDLELLKDFLEGKNIHVTKTDKEIALKDHTKRLSELLGLKSP